MPALNSVQLIGYLGKDPETRFTPSGKNVCQFSLGVTQHWKSGGEAKTATEWINIETWGRLGEICQEYLHKGSLVYVEGRLKTDRYEVDGQTRYFTKVVGLSLQMLDRKGAEQEPAGATEDVISSIAEPEGEYEVDF